jgi:hypothetical protein
MVKCDNAKLEFTQTNPTQNFNINTKVYGKTIECAVKSAGKSDNDYFSAKFKFKIQINKNAICSVYFTDVTHIGKSATPIKKKCKYFYYYDVNCPDSSNSGSIIDDTFEQLVYDNFKTMILGGTVTSGYGCTVNISFTLPPFFDYLVMYVKIGCNEYNSSSCDNNINDILHALTRTDCSGCSSSYSSSSCSSSTYSNSSKCIESSDSSCVIYKQKPIPTPQKKTILSRILKMIAWSAVITFIVYLFKKKFGSKVPQNLNMSVQTTQTTQTTQITQSIESNQIEQINDAQSASMSGLQTHELSQDKDQVKSQAELIQE